eukprot:6208282-Pyramimonas_sp.AAC.1
MAAREADQGCASQVAEVKVLKYMLMIVKPSFKQRRILENAIETLEAQIRKIQNEKKKLADHETE